MNALAGTFTPSTVFTPANMSVVNLSVAWGLESGPPLYDMGLGKSDAAKIGEALDSGKPVPRMLAIDTFKLIYAADNDAQLPRGKVDDTLARLTMVGEPQNIGRAMRSLHSYWRIGTGFRPRFARIVSLARELSAQTFLSEETRGDILETATVGMAPLGFEPPMDTPRQFERLGPDRSVVAMARAGAVDKSLSPELRSAWAAFAEDLAGTGKSVKVR